MQEYSEKPVWRRGWWSGPISDLINPETRRTLGGWHWKNWVDKVLVQLLIIDHLLGFFVCFLTYLVI